MVSLACAVWMQSSEEVSLPFSVATKFHTIGKGSRFLDPGRFALSPVSPPACRDRAGARRPWRCPRADWSFRLEILTSWLRAFLPQLPATDPQLAEDLTLHGIAVEGIFPASCGGSRFAMDITTNRVDAMNHYGVAREAAALYGLPLPPLQAGLAAPLEADWPGDGFPVRIEARDGCGRFTARAIRGVTVKPATGAIAEYFNALGQKSISGAVDATNFGWLAMGQPTHVFDLDTIEGGIVVRRAFAGERLRLLDGTERTLVAEDLVVADERKALGLAGIMGGWDSRVTEATRNILVEAAWFEPAAIRASSRRHGLHTDASHRFERGADFNAAPVANHLVTRLVQEQAGGAVAGPLVDVMVDQIAARTADRAPVTLRVAEVRRLLGATRDEAEHGPGKRTGGLTEARIEAYLTALGCGLTASGIPGEFAVALPSWRLDLDREVDLIEEIARLYGYNRFANTLPGWAGEVRELPGARQAAAMRSTLRALGYTEAISSTFVSAAEAAEFGRPEDGVVALGNPLSEEAGSLRSSLLPGMAGMLARNLSRGLETVRLFELGTVFTGSAAAVHEQGSLVLGATGGVAAGPLYRPEDALLFAVKGACEGLLARFGADVRFGVPGTPGFGAEAVPPWTEPAWTEPAWMEPGRGACALLAGTPVAWVGELRATAAGARKVRGTCVLAEIDAARLLALPPRQPVLREISRFQAVERDFSFRLPDGVPWGAVEASVCALGIAELQRVVPVEIFREPKGADVGAAATYSLLFRAVLQSAENTLTDEELTAASERIAAALRGLGGVQRA